MEEREKKLNLDMKLMVNSLHPGDLICVEWCDASVGKSSSNGAFIDVPVQSWGVFVGLLGNKAKHIVIAQNSFRYSDGMFDLDYTAVPLSWTIDCVLIVAGFIPKDVAAQLVNSFLMGGGNARRQQRMCQYRVFQQRLSIDGKGEAV